MGREHPWGKGVSAITSKPITANSERGELWISKLAPHELACCRSGQYDTPSRSCDRRKKASW